MCSLAGEDRLYRIIVVFLLTGAAMLLIFQAAEWYAGNAGLPRYCEKPDQTILLVHEILTSDTPAEGKKRRPYIIAAKLIFLVPQEDAEPVDAYMLRLRERISQTCGWG
jgi:hypothetical protein